jgi:hypothetical protein
MAIEHAARLRLRQVALVLGAGLALASCTLADPNVAMTQQAVTPVTAGEAADVSADDLVAAMLKAGFSREQILKDGPAVHESLATSGGAQIRDGKFVSALFSIHAGKLYVTSRTRGTFMVDLPRKRG